MPKKGKVAIKLPKIFDRNCCVGTPEMAFQIQIVVLEHQKWHFKNFLWGGRGGLGRDMSPEPPRKGGLRRLRQYLSENFIPIFKAHWRLDSLFF